MTGAVDVKKKNKKRKAVRSPAAQVYSMPGRLARTLLEAEELVHEERWEEALARLEDVARRFPDQPELLSILAGIYYGLRDSVGYLDACERLVRVGGRDRDALQNLAGAYLENQFPALALRIFRGLLRRAPEDVNAGEWRQIAARLEALMQANLAQSHLEGPDALRLAEQHEEVQVALELGHISRAIRLGQDLLRQRPDFAPVLNNITTGYAAEGRFDEAIAAAERVLALQPDNVHALSNLCRCLVLCGRVDEARAIADRLVASEGHASNVWVKKVEALAHLGDDGRTLELFERAEREGDGEDPMLLHLAAVASMRLGRDSDARTYWQRALRLRPGFELAIGNLEDLRRPPAERHAPWAYPLDHWIPVPTFRELRRHLQRTKGSRDRDVEEAARRFLQQHPEIVTLVPILLERGDPEARRVALMLVRLAETPELLAAARDYALGQRGPDKSRLHAATIAIEAGLIEPGRMRMWMKGEWKEVLLQGIEVDGEASSNYDHDPQVGNWLRESIEAMHEGDTERAEELLMCALQVEPNKPDLLNNLAAVYSRTGRGKEARAMIERAFALDHDYVFARANMARWAAERGETERARELLQPLLEREKLHPSEFASLASAQVELNLAEGDLETAQGWLETWEASYPDDPVLSAYRRRSGISRRPGWLSNPGS